MLLVVAGATNGALFTTTALLDGADVSLGSVLRASDPAQSWTSPSKTFALGFTKSQQNPSLFVFGVIHSPSIILIWTAGDASSAAVDGDTFVNFSSDGNLRLLNGSGTVVWQFGTEDKGVSVAGLDDSGNFVLKNLSSTVWDTFSHPADVLVQTQNFTVRQKLRSGLYSFTLSNSTGKLSLEWNDTIEYWSLSNSTFSGNLTAPVIVLDTDGVVNLLDPFFQQVRWIYSSDYTSSASFRFLRLDSDGNLRAYSVSANGASVQWSAVGDQCKVYGWCGNNGMCIYNDAQPLCTCLSQDFIPVDPDDPRQGCNRKQQLEDCPGNVSMLELKDKMFLTYAPESNDLNQIIFAPFSPCMKTGGCAGSTSLGDGSGRCFFKISGFISAYQASTVSSTSFVKVCGLGVLNPDRNTDGGTGGEGAPRRRLQVGAIAVVVVGTCL